MKTPIDMPPPTTPTLWQAMYRLYHLLVQNENREKLYQDLFEQHPVIFQALGFHSFQSYEKKSCKKLPLDRELGVRYEPDFLCSSKESSRVTIFELKTPFVGGIIVRRSKGTRKSFKAKINSYIAQATEYAESIRGSVEARKIVALDLGLEGISSYNIIVVCGLSTDNPPAEVARISANRTIPTEILYFDSLLNRLMESYRLSRTNTEGRVGLCIVYHLILHPHQNTAKSFIADHGTTHSDRLSVFIENGCIAFCCIDSHGKTHELRSNVPFNLPVFLRFEFSNDCGGIYMSLNVDNEERDLRQGSVPFDFRPDTRAICIGADLNGQNGGRFQLMEHYHLERTMGLTDKLGSYDYFTRKAFNLDAAVDFDGSSFLERSPKGDMIQQVPEKQPKFRKPAGYPAA